MMNGKGNTCKANGCNTHKLTAADTLTQRNTSRRKKIEGVGNGPFRIEAYKVRSLI